MPNRLSTAPTPPLKYFAEKSTAAVLITLLLAALAYIAWSGMQVLLLTFAGVLFAIFLHGISDSLSQKSGLSYRVSLAIVTFILFLATALTGVLLAHRLATQVDELVKELPQSLGKIRESLNEYPLGHYLTEKVPKAAEQSKKPG